MEDTIGKENEIAEWMLKRLEKNGHLYQNEIVEDILHKFGKEYTHENDNGNLAIHKDVLSAFRNITEKEVVWERGEKMWRFRQSSDTPNKRLTD